MQVRYSVAQRRPSLKNLRFCTALEIFISFVGYHGYSIGFSVGGIQVLEFRENLTLDFVTIITRFLSTAASVRLRKGLGHPNDLSACRSFEPTPVAQRMSVVYVHSATKWPLVYHLLVYISPSSPGISRAGASPYYSLSEIHPSQLVSYVGRDM